MFIRYLTLIAVVILLVTLVEFSSVYVHELAHVAINKNHKCLNQSIKFEWDRAYTACYEREELTEAEDLQLRYLHNLNEIVGYNIHHLKLSIILGAGLISFCLLTLRNRKSSGPKEPLNITAPRPPPRRNPRYKPLKPGGEALSEWRLTPSGSLRRRKGSRSRRL